MMKRFPILLCVALGVSGCDSLKKTVSKTDANLDKLENAISKQGGTVHVLTADSYDDFIAQSGTLVVVDFYADWCGPCKKLAPILDKLATEFGDRVVVGKLDVDKHGEVSQRIGVEGIPDVRFYRDGKEVDKIIGLPPETEIRLRFERHMKGVEPRPTEGTPVKTDTVTTKPKEPAIQPMQKDWMPPGMQKK